MFVLQANVVAGSTLPISQEGLTSLIRRLWGTVSLPVNKEHMNYPLMDLYHLKVCIVCYRDDVNYPVFGCKWRSYLHLFRGCVCCWVSVRASAYKLHHAEGAMLLCFWESHLCFCVCVRVCVRACVHVCVCFTTTCEHLWLSSPPAK